MKGLPANSSSRREIARCRARTCARFHRTAAWHRVCNFLRSRRVNSSREENDNMKRALVAVVAMAMIFAAGTVAMAADKEGTVKLIQVNERVIVLSDGTQMH